jgi:hypothetical protein
MATAEELERRQRLDEMEFTDIYGETREYDREHHVITTVQMIKGRPVIILGMASQHLEDPAPDNILLPIEQLDLVRELFGEPDVIENGVVL